MGSLITLLKRTSEIEGKEGSRTAAPSSCS